MSRTLMRPSDIRKAVAEWCAMGLSVTIKADGDIKVEPQAQEPDRLSAELIDWRKP